MNEIDKPKSSINNGAIKEASLGKSVPFQGDIHCSFKY